MAKRIGIYPGTFDPITLGHMDIIERGAKLVDELIIGVTTNIAKSPMFDDDERIAMVEDLNRSGPGGVKALAVATCNNRDEVKMLALEDLLAFRQAEAFELATLVCRGRLGLDLPHHSAAELPTAMILAQLDLVHVRHADRHALDVLVNDAPRGEAGERDAPASLQRRRRGG